MSRQPAVYILSSKRNETHYVSVTSNLVKRVWEHRNNMVEGFTNYRGGKAELPRLSPLRTGHADLLHPALQSVVNLVRTEVKRDGHHKG